MEINIGKLNLEIKITVKRKRYYLLWSERIQDYVGSTVDDDARPESGITRVEVTKSVWKKKGLDQ